MNPDAGRPAKSRVRRSVRALVLPLVSGVTLTVLFAAVPMVREPQFQQVERWLDEGLNIEWGRDHSWLVTRTVVSNSPDLAYGHTVDGEDWSMYFGTGEKLLPDKLASEYVGWVLEPGFAYVRMLTIVEVGWPLACFSYRLEESNATGPLKRIVVGGLPLIDGAPDPDGISHVLPLRVRWEGLLFNACTLALPVAALRGLVPSCRRRLRRSRGECPWCRYPVAGLEPVCPECGQETCSAHRRNVASGLRAG